MDLQFMDLQFMGLFERRDRSLGLARHPRTPLRVWSASLALAGVVFVVAVHTALTQAVLPWPGATIVLTRELITPIPSPPAADPAKLKLGEELFQSRRLSHNQTLSCMSCHDVRSNGADNRERTIGSDGRVLSFNTPTVFNAALSFRLQWEGNERSLQSQAAAAISGVHGLGSSMPEALARLNVQGDMNAQSDMAAQFHAAYGRDPDEASVLDALATYERSLLTPDSPFDRWLKGDKDALSAREQNGYALFKSYGCISCHQGVNVGGNMFQRQGVFHRLASPEPAIVRVPSLRNVAATAPYFHDGSAATLQDAVRRMAAAQLDQTLSGEEIDTLVAFLGTLTGSYRGVPVTAAAPKAVAP